MEEQLSTYFMIIKSLYFNVGTVIATDKLVSIKEVEIILCDASTKVKIITEEQYSQHCSS